MAGNTRVELSLMVGGSNSMLGSFILPTFNSCMVDTLLNFYVANIKPTNI